MDTPLLKALKWIAELDCVCMVGEGYKVAKCGRCQVLARICDAVKETRQKSGNIESPSKGVKGDKGVVISMYHLIGVADYDGLLPTNEELEALTKEQA